jgi:DNA-directed RNA polymerase specialized sigma24 family protein
MLATARVVFVRHWYGPFYLGVAKLPEDKMSIMKCENCTNESYGEMDGKLLCSDCITKLSQQKRNYFAPLNRAGRKPKNRYWFKGRVLLGIGASQGCYRISNTKQFDWNPSDQTLAEQAAEPHKSDPSLYQELHEILYVYGEIERLSDEDRKLIAARASDLSTRQIAQELNVDHSTVLRRLDRIFDHLINLYRKAA